MKEPMAFRAAYSDWKLIKTRGVVQVVLEVPLADADAAYNVLGGMPDASRENWFAVAPLKLPPAEKESSPPAEPRPATDKPPVAVKREKQNWRDIPPAAQAAMLCDKPVFRAFLAERYTDEWHESMTDGAECVRIICGVASRSMLNEGAHRVIWHQLNERYDLWVLKERVGA